MNLNILKKKQATKEVKLSLREKKHQANLRKNNGLYFQIGLVATLFIVFGVFQLKFTMDPIEIEKSPVDIGEVLDIVPVDYIIEENIQKKVEKQPVKTQTTSLENPKIIEDDDKDLVETVVNTEVVVVDSAPNIEDVQVIDAPVDVDTIPVSLVSEYPVFPGCDKFEDKKSQAKCFQQKITKHIIKKFDGDIAADNGLEGELKIMVMFTINHKGDITDVKARAPHPELKKEAIKAVSSLPKMSPAKQGYKKVNVTYALPVVFKID